MQPGADEVTRELGRRLSRRHAGTARARRPSYPALRRSVLALLAWLAGRWRVVPGWEPLGLLPPPPAGATIVRTESVRTHDALVRGVARAERLVIERQTPAPAGATAGSVPPPGKAGAPALKLSQVILTRYR